MSNTSTVTPYNASAESSDNSTGLAAAAAVACISGAVTLARWLAEETQEDREAIDRLRNERRSDLLGKRVNSAADHLSARREPLNITTVGLQLRNPEPLVRTAERLGYQMEPSLAQSTSLAEQPQILLRRASGERLAIARNETGRLVVHSIGDRRRIQNLVRQHTVDRAVEHLASKGMGVQTATLPNGEVQILARERSHSKRGGSAEIKAHVHIDGTALVDVDKVRGNRCEEIVRDLAQAVGGEVSGMTKKDSYFQLPGEPTKTQVKV
jgi:hypothetical protein